MGYGFWNSRYVTYVDFFKNSYHKASKKIIY